MLPVTFIKLHGAVSAFKMCVIARHSLRRFQYSWPAISDIGLGVRTVPVLSVAKEIAAPARSPNGRGATEHRQVDAN